jgi:hypothetical protein
MSGIFVNPGSFVELEKALQQDTDGWLSMNDVGDSLL